MSYCDRLVRDWKLTPAMRVALEALLETEELAYFKPGGWMIGDLKISGRIGQSLVWSGLVKSDDIDTFKWTHLRRGDVAYFSPTSQIKRILSGEQTLPLLIQAIRDKQEPL